VVEVDGGTHSTDAELTHDASRTRHLESLGYRVFRLSNDDVYNNLDGALDTLLAFVEAGR
jgi:very-short-patch-repair endonuclease